ncbi:MAG: EF-hand domain-containing protein [Planctomycetota bacterium]
MGGSGANAAIGTATLSQRTLTGAMPASASYAAWTMPGQGVNPTRNDAAASMTPPAGGLNQFAVAFTEFEQAGGGASYDAVVGAIVNYDASDPFRMYITRTQAIGNGLSSNQNTAQFGLGAVEASGVVAVRADDGPGGSVTGPNATTGDSVLTIDLAARNCGVLNVFDREGASDDFSSEWMIRNSSIAHAVPVVASSVAFGGATPVFAANLASELARGDAFGAVTSDRDHLAAGSRHRGAASFAALQDACFGTTSGVVGVLSTTGTFADSITVTGLDSNGEPTSVTTLSPPALVSLIDFATGESSPRWGGSSGPRFDGYDGGSAFRGAAGQVAINGSGDDFRIASRADLDPSGVAGGGSAVVVSSRVGGCNSLFNLAAYTSSAGAGGFGLMPDTGKPILDGPGGTAVGRLTSIRNVDANMTGPSLSSPAIDSAGNVWFTGAVELFGPSGSTFEIGLLRGVLNASGLGWELELVLRTGDVYTGANSATAWRLERVDVAAGFHSQSLQAGGFLGASYGDLPTSAGEHLGGAVLTAAVVYDTSGDGIFNSPESLSFDPGLDVDEAYDMVLYLTADADLGGVCPPDQNRDGMLDIDDFSSFVANFFAADPVADVNGDGQLDIDDFSSFVNQFFNPVGCDF